jgi:hypothetical protein
MRFPSGKPLLLLAARCDELSRNERRLIEHGTWVDSSGMFDLYSLPLASFRDIFLDDARMARKELSSKELFPCKEYFSKDSIQRAVLVNYDSLTTSDSYQGKGCFTGVSNQYNRIFEGKLPHADTSVVYTGSIWLGNFRKDLIPRTALIVTQADSAGNEISYESWTVFRKLEAIDGDWGRIEWTFKLRQPDVSVRVFLYNEELWDREMRMDELIIRPSGLDVYSSGEGWIMKNNRYYFDRDLSSL